jgi:hypothetical protein
MPKADFVNPENLLSFTLVTSHLANPGSEGEERYESMVTLHSVRHCARRSARCVCTTAISATLAGHAYLPAQAISLAPPQDAPESFAISGKYTGPNWRRVDAVGTIPGTSYISDKSAPRPTGVSTPFKGQPLQGFSGIKAVEDGSFWVMTDNGFGAKKDSADALLMFHRIKPD